MDEPGICANVQGTKKSGAREKEAPGPIVKFASDPELSILIRADDFAAGRVDSFWYTPICVPGARVKTPLVSVTPTGNPVAGLNGHD